MKWPGNAFALKLIKQVLYSGPKSRKELLKLTGLPERTLRYNLVILKKRGIVKEVPVLSDLRKKLFVFNGDVMIRRELAKMERV